MKYNIKKTNAKAARTLYSLTYGEREKLWQESLAQQEWYEEFRHKFMAVEWCPIHGHSFLFDENKCCMCGIEKEATLNLKK